MKTSTSTMLWLAVAAGGAFVVYKVASQPTTPPAPAPAPSSAAGSFVTAVGGALSNVLGSIGGLVGTFKQPTGTSGGASDPLSNVPFYGAGAQSDNTDEASWQPMLYTSPRKPLGAALVRASGYPTA